MSLPHFASLHASYGSLPRIDILERQKLLGVRAGLRREIQADGLLGRAPLRRDETTAVKLDIAVRGSVALEIAFEHHLRRARVDREIFVLLVDGVVVKTAVRVNFCGPSGSAACITSSR